ncbi:arabinofuranosidase catalytic domain-containing protein [Lysobacter niastensis]|uniref:Alpha-L-arabinofuranosidase B catalytic domain-containing protein n=1 Tax=Lysobacter niastensis TaxID=380629 RepID=A0ABS0B4Q0_9GAMM|nr:arabinofuranosidase catalytic domain-containing protein [Lysobacter niastensis]MBF6022863.1 hypothetical protein [Lysobacter niastensis]
MMIINPYAFATAVPYLDLLATTPRAALSLRKLISTATTAIRVRRSSDNAEQDIGFSGNALDTASLASFVGSNSAFITKFYDQTGNGEDLVQATGSKQPRIVSAGVYDAEAVFDGASDAMAIASLTLGAAQVGVYMKTRQQGAAPVEIIAELSANYNSNAQSFVLYSDSSSGASALWAGSRNTTAGSDYRLSEFPAIGLLGVMRQITVLLDRTITGNGEIAAWQGGVSAAPTVWGAPAEQTGTYSSYDLHVASRAGSSLFRGMSLESLVVYNADTAAIRADIEAVVA